MIVLDGKFKWVENYIGIPFLDKGRDALGADCWGLVRLVYAQECDITLPHLNECYDNTLDSEAISKTVFRESRSWKTVTKGTEQTFDVIVMRMMGVPMHVGLVLENNLMLHVHQGCDAVIENYMHFQWKNRITGIIRHQNLL